MSTITITISIIITITTIIMIIMFIIIDSSTSTSTSSRQSAEMAGFDEEAPISGFHKQWTGIVKDFHNK